MVAAFGDQYPNCDEVSSFYIVRYAKKSWQDHISNVE